MTSRDLAIEYAVALRATGFADLAPLLAAGIGGRALALTMPALDRIARHGGLYEPAPDGGVAFILPVRCDDLETPETPDPDAVIANGCIVDLLAFDPRFPASWALRLGLAEWLGAVPPQYMAPAPTPVWRTPLSWLRAGCRGLVLLSVDAVSNYRALSLLDVVSAEDAPHAAELRQVLAHPWPAPPVVVRGARRAA